MTKARWTQVLTVALLAGALAMVLLRNRGNNSAPTPASPEDAIYAMLDAARNGDPAGYLDRFTGPMRQTLKQVVMEQSEAKFSKYLKDSNAALKGVAVSAPESEADGVVKVRVEYVYADRNEAQFLYLRKESGAWKIFQIDGATRAKTLVPYGTPVTE